MIGLTNWKNSFRFFLHIPSLNFGKSVSLQIPKKFWALGQFWYRGPPSFGIGWTKTGIGRTGLCPPYTIPRNTLTAKAGVKTERILTALESSSLFLKNWWKKIVRIYSNWYNLFSCSNKSLQLRLKSFYSLV